jgi:hypothetical protein
LIRIFPFCCLLLAGYAFAQGGLQPAVAPGQPVLTNDSILKMVKAGLGEDLIVATIKAQSGQYKTTPDDLIALKAAGVTEKIITAIVDRAAPAGVDRLGNAVSDSGAVRPVQEVGIYYMKVASWTDLSPEIVNFKTGGALKHVTTIGIVKGDVNGHVNKKHSTTSLKSPVRLLVYTPEGVAITEYQFLHLHEEGGSREFRTVTGGVFHVSGGATRDLMPFESKKVAPRTYEISLSDLKPGEYGLLPPTSLDATASSGRIGKIYSFSVIE